MQRKTVTTYAHRPETAEFDVEFGRDAPLWPHRFAAVVLDYLGVV